MQLTYRGALQSAALFALTLLAPGCRTLPGGAAARRLPTVEILIGGRMEGSGYIADAGGTVVTADHVVRQHTRGLEVLWEGKRLSATLVARDILHDLALLQLPVPEQPYPFIPTAQSTPATSARVVLHGSAQFDHDVRFHGWVARRRPVFRYFAKRQGFMECWLVNSFSPPGTSGGAWVDSRGRVVGVQSGFMNYRENSMSGVALVTSPAAIRELLASRTTPRRPRLGCGIEELWSQPKGFIARFPPGTEGLITIPIEEDGPVAAAGLTRESLIVAVNGKPVRFRPDLVGEVYRHEPGEELKLTVLAPDTTEPVTRRVRLGTMP